MPVVSTDEGNIIYKTKGTSKPVIFLHLFGGSSELWTNNDMQF